MLPTYFIPLASICLSKPCNAPGPPICWRTCELHIPMRINIRSLLQANTLCMSSENTSRCMTWPEIRLSLSDTSCCLFNLHAACPPKGCREAHLMHACRERSRGASHGAPANVSSRAFDYRTRWLILAQTTDMLRYQSGLAAKRETERAADLRRQHASHLLYVHLCIVWVHIAVLAHLLAHLLHDALALPLARAHDHRPYSHILPCHRYTHLALQT